MKNLQLLSSNAFIKNKEIYIAVTNALDFCAEYMIRWIKINHRLFMTFILNSIIPIVVLGIISISLATSSMQENVGKYNSEIIKQLSKNIMNEASKYNAVSYDIVSSTEMVGYMDTLSSDDDLKIQSKLKDVVFLQDRKKEALKGIECIYFYTADYLEKTKIDNKNITVVKEGNSIDPIWAFTNDIVTNDATYHIDGPVLYRKVISTAYKFVGVLVIAPKHDEYTNLISNLNLGSQEEVYIVNNENLILASTKNEKVGKKDSNINIEKNASNNYVLKDISGERMLICSRNIEAMGWRVLSIIPLKVLMVKIADITRIIVIICVVAIILSILMSFLITRSITIPLGKIGNVVRGLKDGDFTNKMEVKYKDEIALLSIEFNSMIDQVKEMIKEVDEATGQVASFANNAANHSAVTTEIGEQVTKAISEMAESSAIQAKEAQNSKERMDSLSSRINNMTENTVQMIDIAAKTKKLSDKSLEVVSNLNIKSMETNEVMNTISKDIIDLNTDMKLITSIVKVISGISESTNLLSLNAQIEAARAGAAGRGFAVVASEIKKLAEQSQQSSQSINGIIQGIIIKVGNIVKKVDAATSTIEKQTYTVSETDKSFNEISQATDTIVHKINCLNESMQQMVKIKYDTVLSIENISTILMSASAGMEQINASTEEQLASSEELTDLCRNLMNMSNKLQNSISKFKI